MAEWTRRIIADLNRWLERTVRFKVSFHVTRLLPVVSPPHGEGGRPGLCPVWSSRDDTAESTPYLLAPSGNRTEPLPSAWLAEGHLQLATCRNSSADQNRRTCRMKRRGGSGRSQRRAAPGRILQGRDREDPRTEGGAGEDQTTRGPCTVAARHYKPRVKLECEPAPP